MQVSSRWHDVQVRRLRCASQAWCDGPAVGLDQPSGWNRRELPGVNALTGGLVGSVLCDTDKPLELPTATSLTTGAFWHSEFGRATRQCLDQMVRDACVRVGPESATAPENENPPNLGA